MIRRMILGLGAALLVLSLACGKKAVVPAGALPVGFGKDTLHLVLPEGLVDAYRDEPAAKAFADTLNASGNTLEYFLVTPADKVAYHEGRNPDLKRYAMVFTLKPGLRERRCSTLDFQDVKKGMRLAFGDDPAMTQRTQDTAAQVSKKFSESHGVDAKMDLAKPRLVEAWDMGSNATGVLATSRVKVAVAGRSVSDAEVGMVLHMVDLDGHLLMLGLYGDDVTLPGLHGIRDRAKAWTKATQEANDTPWFIW